jgi:hypothetical protein
MRGSIAVLPVKPAAQLKFLGLIHQLVPQQIVFSL